jgi:hypothetical protein
MRKEQFFSEIISFFQVLRRKELSKRGEKYDETKEVSSNRLPIS